MQGALLLDVVIGKRAAVLKLLSSKDQTLLIRGDSLLVLDLLLHVLDRVVSLHLERDGLTRQRLHEDLHSSAQTKHQMQGALLLDVVIGKRAAVLKLLSSKDQTLLIRGDSLLVLDLLLHVLGRVGSLHLERDG